MSESAKIKKIAVVGGTGKEGSGLALRWAHAGYDVVIGSRTPEKAKRVVAELNEQLGAAKIRAMTNEQAAQEAEIIVLTVPYAAHASTLNSIASFMTDKILVDVTVPIVPPNFTTVTLPPGRTAAEEAQALLGDRVRVVSAFQNVSAIHLKHLVDIVNCDVLVAGADADAKRDVIALAEAAGMRGIDVGPLGNAIVAESLTPILVGINKRYGVKGAGIRITEIG